MIIYSTLVTESGDTEEDREARALLNKFLGASVLMSGVESMMPAAGTAGGSRKEVTTTVSSARPSSHQVSGDFLLFFLGDQRFYVKWSGVE